MIINIIVLPFNFNWVRSSLHFQTRLTHFCTIVYALFDLCIEFIANIDKLTVRFRSKGIIDEKT